MSPERSTHDTYLVVNWQEFHNLVFKLSKKIAKDNTCFSLIVAVARGGLTTGHLLSDFLKLSVATCTIASYKNLKQKNAPYFIYKVGSSLKNKQVLVVDDVSDTGKTFSQAVSHVKKCGAKLVKTASIHIKPHTAFVPDFYVSSVDKWIVYPFEARETITTLSKTWKSKGLKKTTIRRNLIKMGFMPYLVSAFV